MRGSGFRPKLLKCLKSFLQLLTAGTMSSLYIYIFFYLSVSNRQQTHQDTNDCFDTKRVLSLKSRGKFFLKSKESKRNLSSRKLQLKLEIFNIKNTTHPHIFSKFRRYWVWNNEEWLIYANTFNFPKSTYFSGKPRT